MSYARFSPRLCVAVVVGRPPTGRAGLPIVLASLDLEQARDGEQLPDCAPVADRLAKNATADGCTDVVVRYPLWC